VPGVLHRGFINAFNSIAASVGAEFDALKTRGATLHVTGHSLGAALATLASLHCEARASSAGIVASVHTFGSPRVGDPVFAAAFARALRGRAFRFVNHEDIVTRVPPPRLPLRGRELHYSHVGEMTYIDADGRILGGVTFMFRLLNFATSAIGDAKSAVVTTLKDHAMQRYCDSLRRAT
jgi:predicted lipase